MNIIAGSDGSAVCENGSSGGSNEAGSFECNICFELAQDPIVTLCGHLFCWPCLYKWLHFHARSKECPICKALIEEDKLVPLYGRGKVTTDPRSKSIPGIPNRPNGLQPAIDPLSDANHFGHPNPPYVGGTSVGGARLGNYRFSAAIGSLFPYLNFQVHGLADATPYAGFPFSHANMFHLGHAHAFHQHMPQGQHTDSFLKVLLIMVGILLLVFCVSF